VSNFGATIADWEANHVRDPRFPSGAYDPQSALARDRDGLHTAKRYQVIEQTGRITAYKLRFPAQTTINAARTEVMNEFPGDATASWFTVKDNCSQMFLQSATLQRIFGPGRGALVAFYSGRAADHYDPRDVWTAALLLMTYSSTLQNEFGC